MLFIDLFKTHNTDTYTHTETENMHKTGHDLLIYKAINIIRITVLFDTGCLTIQLKENIE